MVEMYNKKRKLFVDIGYILNLSGFHAGTASDSHNRLLGSFSTVLKISCQHADCRGEKGSSFSSSGQNLQSVF